MNRLLLVEDDFQISEIIEDYFSSKCDEFEITCVFDGSAGLEYIKNNNYVKKTNNVQIGRILHKYREKWWTKI